MQGKKFVSIVPKPESEDTTASNMFKSLAGGLKSDKKCRKVRDGADCVNYEYDDGGEEFIEESALSSNKQKNKLIKRDFRKQDGAGPNSMQIKHFFCGGQIFVDVK